MNFENEKYQQKAQVEVLGASVEVWADSTAATRIAKTFFFETAISKTRLLKRKLFSRLSLKVCILTVHLSLGNPR
jgi:hypothetical protein